MGAQPNDVLAATPDQGVPVGQGASPRAPRLCRWCGSKLNEGAVVCAVCGRQQRFALRDILSTGSNVIAVLAVLLTAGQLISAMKEGDSASKAAQDASASQTAANHALYQANLLAGSMKAMQANVEQERAEIKTAELHITSVETRVNADEQLKAQIDDAKAKLDAAQKTFDAAQAVRNAIPPVLTQSVQTPQVHQECNAVALGIRSCIPVVQMVGEPITVPNKDYQNADQRATQAFGDLQGAQKNLAALLKSAGPTER